MSYRLDRLKEISPADRDRFEADGFLIVERLLEPEHIQNLRSRAFGGFRLDPLRFFVACTMGPRPAASAD